MCLIEIALIGMVVTKMVNKKKKVEGVEAIKTDTSGHLSPRDP